MQYVVISPVRNEEDYIQLTLDSVISQTIKPIKWIIVDDGSQDKTAQIAQRYLNKFSWIYLLTLSNRGFRQRGEGVINAFNAGFALVNFKFDFIAKLDGDVSFQHDYFERLFDYFKSNPALGIAGGGIYIKEKNSWVLERVPSDHVRGATKVYRRKCFEDIKGLQPVGGWDSIDEIKAQMKGWETRSFEDLIVFHHRPLGQADGKLSTMVKSGVSSYVRGYHPLAMLFRGAVRAIKDRPILLSGLAMWWGYLKSWLINSPQFDDPELVAYYRKKTLRRLAFWRQWNKANLANER